MSNVTRPATATASPAIAPASPIAAASAGDVCTWSLTTTHAWPIGKFPDETRRSCLQFLFNALHFFKAHGLKVQRITTDNGTSLESKRYAPAGTTSTSSALHQTLYAQDCWRRRTPRPQRPARGATPPPTLHAGATGTCAVNALLTRPFRL